ncbi:hypothetical protein BaRGS_00001645, partial [Batillaria attramentaria]
AAGVVVGHPFDTVKAKGFFRGMSFPLMSYALINSVFFGVYDYTLRTLYYGGPLSHMPFHSSVLVAGCVGGAAQLLVACPSDVVKVVLQSQIPETATAQAARYYTGPRQCIQHILRTSGVTGMYKGMAAMACRDVPGYGIYLVVFELIDEKMHKHQLTDHH